MTFLLVSLFGGLGAVVRFAAEYVTREHHPTRRPWATAGVNALGALIVGLALSALAGPSDAHLRDIVITGFCGGLTTFSSAFAIPALLQREHHWAYAAALVLATPILAGGAFALGLALGH